MIDYAGQQLGNYRLLKVLGSGGFARVYLGEHIYLKTPAAIKVLQTRLTQDALNQFLAEARTIARLSHPNIIRVLEFGIQDETPYLVMNYAPYGSLRQRHPTGSVLTPGRVLSYVRQMAAALQYAHERQIIHRDVKPENMLLGDNFVLLLSDFGIAMRAPGAGVTRTPYAPPNAAGTTTYMAPEQIDGAPTPASDQYALGVVVYEWLCGSPPFVGGEMLVALQHLQAPPPPLREKQPALSPAIEMVVLKALAKDPRERFASVADFARALEAAFAQAADEPTVEVPATRLTLSVPTAPEPEPQRPGRPLLLPARLASATETGRQAAQSAALLARAERPESAESSAAEARADSPAAGSAEAEAAAVSPPSLASVEAEAASAGASKPSAALLPAVPVTPAPPSLLPRRSLRWLQATLKALPLGKPLPETQPLSRRQALLRIGALALLSAATGDLAVSALEEQLASLSSLLGRQGPAPVSHPHPTATAQVKPSPSPTRQPAKPTPQAQGTAQALIMGINSRPALASWGVRQLDLFIRAADNTLWHRHFDGHWRDWERLTGSLAFDPVAVAWGPERFDLFVRGVDNSLLHCWFDGSWHDWESLGGSLTSNPAVASWGAGRLDVFARGSDNALWHKWYDGLWHDWESLGGVITSAPAAVSWGPGRLDVFARGADNALWHRAFGTRWGPWESLGGSFIYDPTVASWGAGRLDVFACSPAGSLLHLAYDGSWHSWESFGGRLVSSPTAISWGPAYIDIFARADTNALQHLWFDGSWHPWTVLN
ncbi:protein kinase domain-containing protein [Thermogemmatispora carboxidivorans]|uniref:protein kinase domain-containing protein n=1 Tax=Thermogemmatispora carboxidivorans TaxID=1382306 RepID=UPI00069C2BB3|nr:protein kinase [Thermogemmatispora carboxidivorans]